VVSGEVLYVECDASKTHLDSSVEPVGVFKLSMGDNLEETVDTVEHWCKRGTVVVIGAFGWIG
jgi:hypothetical protein